MWQYFVAACAVSLANWFNSTLYRFFQDKISQLQVLVETLQVMSQLHKEKKKRSKNKFQECPSIAIFIINNFSSLSWSEGEGLLIA